MKENTIIEMSVTPTATFIDEALKRKKRSAVRPINVMINSGEVTMKLALTRIRRAKYMRGRQVSIRYK